LTYKKNKPIWIVSHPERPLQEAEAKDLKDLWSETDADNLPPYRTEHQLKMHTSVIHPLSKEGRAFGVVEFATESYFTPTPASKEEIQTLAAVISRAYQLWDVRKAQHRNTERAIDRLKEALENESWTRLALPKLFVAYPGGERLEGKEREDHRAVIESINAVVEKFENKLEPVFWEKIAETGNINAQVIREILNSEFGLCYFSEPSVTLQCPTDSSEVAAEVNSQDLAREKEGVKFQDNANVLFEAGMMQALTNSPNALFKAWISIREKASIDIPFDIVSERILYIDREGGFRQDDFEKDLEDLMESLFKSVKHKD
jgi:hypothetical protein